MLKRASAQAYACCFQLSPFLAVTQTQAGSAACRLLRSSSHADSDASKPGGHAKGPERSNDTSVDQQRLAAEEKATVDAKKSQVATGSHTSAASESPGLPEHIAAMRSRLVGVVDSMAAAHLWEPQSDAQRQAKATLADARAAAARTKRSRLLTADEPGFQGLYAPDLRNERVAVAVVGPPADWDWSGPWSWKMWLLYAVTPLTAALFAYIYQFERYRWRRGYYHVHQCVEWLESEDVATQWTALDHLSNVAQRPHWRRRVAESQAVGPLVQMVRKEILLAAPFDMPPAECEVAGYNMLLQVLLTINWTMFDEVGEAAIRQTDLGPRLSAALDGPHAWMRWALPRAVARNLLYKLQNPSRRPYLGTGWQRLRAEASEFYSAFPELPERHTYRVYGNGLRGDDPMMGWRGEKIMESNDALVSIPGLKRRLARWRSWWNRSEFLPPTVGRWFRQRKLFYDREREHAAEYWSGEPEG